ncbi:efflux RND transporter periplasmic adaptor subunit [Congregibacter variabilis]|uniref:Efflux RND transporter periplasmic adaptor subunit n=1 Tax=Congregibacter variabilis TaxID=3081200 RepID=A0ABZ0HYR3_9GAMM|nr:efflux RND transporter periplasmic adaptor subunit [Congregibacter sp. IMCC43200]
MKSLVIVIGLAIAGFFAWQQFGGQSDDGARRARPAAPVTVVGVESRSYRDRIPALGTLQAWESIDITAPVSQRITSLNFEDGQTVEKGQVLATLRQESEQASLRELSARLADARREVKRLTDLARKNQVAQTDLDSATTEVEVLQHQLSELEARVADLTIVAPFSGVLGLREVSEGALASVGQRLTTLDDISRMRLQFTVPARYLGVLQPGMTVIARSAAFKEDFVGELSAVGSRVDPVARAITARAVVPNEEGLLRAGLLMEIEITGESNTVLMVPEESLQSRAARHFVWKVEGEQALRSEVKIGARIPGWVVILDGVSEGEQIVRDGVIRLSGNAMPVRVVQG